MYDEKILCVESEEEQDFLESLSEENNFEITPDEILHGEMI